MFPGTGKNEKRRERGQGAMKAGRTSSEQERGDRDEEVNRFFPFQIFLYHKCQN